MIHARFAGKRLHAQSGEREWPWTNRFDPMDALCWICHVIIVQLITKEEDTGHRVAG